MGRTNNLLNYALQHEASVRTCMLIQRHHITETTPREKMIVNRDVGTRMAETIEQLQRDYTATLDVAYRIVIEEIRKRG